jgi:hypothetical protein
MRGVTPMSEKGWQIVRFRSVGVCRMETPDPLLERVSPVLAAVPGVVAVVLGGSRATGAAHSASDYDIGPMNGGKGKKAVLG